MLFYLLSCCDDVCFAARAYYAMAVFFSSSFSFATPPSTTTAGGAGPQAEGLLVPQVASNSATQRSNSRTPRALISDWPAVPKAKSAEIEKFERKKTGARTGVRHVS